MKPRTAHLQLLSIFLYISSKKNQHTGTTVHACKFVTGNSVSATLLGQDDGVDAEMKMKMARHLTSDIRKTE